jgi:fructose-1-phosphate kinase PfkB-like protein
MKYGGEEHRLSQGRKRQFAVTAQTWVGIPPEIEERNPIGQGIAMLAAVVYSLSENASMPDAFKWGIGLDLRLHVCLELPCQIEIR